MGISTLLMLKIKSCACECNVTHTGPQFQNNDMTWPILCCATSDSHIPGIQFQAIERVGKREGGGGGGGGGETVIQHNSFHMSREPLIAAKSVIGTKTAGLILRERDARVEWVPQQKQLK